MCLRMEANLIYYYISPFSIHYNIVSQLSFFDFLSTYRVFGDLGGKGFGGMCKCFQSVHVSFSFAHAITQITLTKVSLSMTEVIMKHSLQYSDGNKRYFVNMND